MDLKLIKLVTWEEVFSSWAKDESHLPHWVEHYKKRGFNSWEEWRIDSTKDLHPEKLNWKLYEIIEPIKTISEFHGGPFRAWVNKYYKNRNHPTFTEIVNDNDFENNDKINEIINNFPKETSLIGLMSDNGIVIIEGMHRCCAIAVANKRKQDLDIKALIFLAEWLGKDVPIMGQGSSPTT